MSNFLAHALVPEIPSAMVFAIVATFYGCAVLSVWLAFRRKKHATIWVGSVVAAIALCAAAPQIAIAGFDWRLIIHGLLFALAITGILLAALGKQST